MGSHRQPVTGNGRSNPNFYLSSPERSDENKKPIFTQMEERPRTIQISRTLYPWLR